jgi:uncharacterized hydrophobic protein (TIGR00271 family)
MSTITDADIERMTTAVFIEPELRSRSSTRFWTLLVLASVIATAGVVADSTATVIGAMIVAPLMTPILGVAVGLVLSNHRPLVRSVLLVVLGALAVIAIAYLIGIVVHPPDDYATNTQVAARISPRFIDLIAALATGLVGAFALVRSDISDTLPGVAIAISLVPPLAVVGLLLQVQRYGDAMQALLLFGTNVAAIIVTGTIVLLVYRVRDAARRAGYPVARMSGRALATVGILVVVVLVPLGIGSLNVAGDQQLQAEATPIAQDWAARAGWQIAVVSVQNRTISVTALGPPPDIEATTLRKELNDAGLAGADLVIRLVVGGTRVCPAYATTCSASVTTP